MTTILAAVVFGPLAVLLVGMALASWFESHPACEPEEPDESWTL